MYDLKSAIITADRPGTHTDIIDELIEKDPGLAVWFDTPPTMTPPFSDIQTYRSQQYKPSPTAPTAAVLDALHEALEHRASRRSAPADITDKQMRALRRDHLIMMLRDTQAELDQLREEYEALLMGLHAGLALHAGGVP